MGIGRTLAAMIVVVSVSAATTVSAQEATPESQPRLDGATWELRELDVGEAQPSSPADPAAYLVTFQSDGTVTIAADCNRATGAYVETGDGSIDIKIGPTTAAACAEGSLSIPFLAALDETTAYRFDAEGDLVLSSPSVDELALLGPSLVGVRWEWTNVQFMNDTTLAPDDPSAYTVEFLSGGTMQITADCNVGSASYVEDRGEIDVTLGAFTLVACPPGSLADVFLRDLEAATSYILRDGLLYLALPMDGGVYEFTVAAIGRDDATPSVDGATPTVDGATPIP